MVVVRHRWSLVTGSFHNVHSDLKGHICHSLQREITSWIRSDVSINPIYILLRFIQWQWFVATLLTNTRHSNFTQCWTNAGSALIQHCVNASSLLGCSSCSPCVRTGLCCLWNVWRPGWGSWAEPRACLCAPPAGAPPGCAAPPPAPAHCATLRGEKTDLLNLKVKIYDSHMENITG